MRIVLPKSHAREDAIKRAILSIESLLRSTPLERSYILTLDEQKPTRSTQQNRYLWGVCYPTILKAGKLEGWSAEEVHDYCLGEHFGWETVEGFGRKRIRPIRRSAKLDKQEFTDFIAFIQQRMAEHGIFIPDPDQEFAEDAA